MAYVSVDAMLNRCPCGCGYSHDARRPTPAQRADGGQPQHLSDGKQTEGEQRQPRTEPALSGEDFQQQGGEPGGMQGYDPAICVGRVFAPSTETHLPLVTLAQAQFKQTL